MSSKNSPALGYAINRAVKWIWNEFKEQPGLSMPHKTCSKMDLG